MEDVHMSNLDMNDLSLFCFYCGQLGHNDSFCEAKMLIGAEVAKRG